MDTPGAASVGDLALAVRDGALTQAELEAACVPSLGDLLLGRGEAALAAARAGDKKRDITLFKSVGTAVQDLATAAAVLTAARRRREAGEGGAVGQAVML